MLDHVILTVNDVERSLKFYTAALKPLSIRMFMPYKGADGHPDLCGESSGGRRRLLDFHPGGEGLG